MKVSVLYAKDKENLCLNSYLTFDQFWSKAISNHVGYFLLRAELIGSC